ncbi:MAG: LLM class flavin-dependent oxidoreductase [Gammaproteobacteria bacterium]|nr:LLM class flavin-dependent oxidoreductase [Gammaproteobacteria bacterium]MBT5202513.1 LLM class flavin-dependent oxidoreductase [Gammaproteobacteria bacterium]MBT6247133.1 LLM class flavin-dependent oxidoreductase [Gammaproteobacteria bacterium]
MKIGISISSSYPPDKAAQGAQWMIERAREARQAELDSLFLGDHHVTPTPYYQNIPMLGRLLAEWNDRPAGVLLLLPLWNPVLAAEQLATLACLSKGRLIMQCALGAGRGQFQGMGAKEKFRTSTFEESLAIIKNLWEGQTVTSDVRWNITEARISPLPPAQIEVWIGASADKALDRAARLGDVWLADPGSILEDLLLKLGVYQEALERHGKEMPATLALRRDIYVAESASDAAQVRAAALKSNYRGIAPEALLIGEVDTVTERLLELQDAGFTDVIIRNLHPDQTKALQSINRLAEVRQRVLAS